MAGPQKITFGDMRDSGVRAVLILLGLSMLALDRDGRQPMAR